MKIFLLETTPQKRQRRLKQDPEFIFENSATTIDDEIDTTPVLNNQTSVKNKPEPVEPVDENPTGGDLYEPGDIVWSKLGSFPWWPALIVSEIFFQIFFIIIFSIA